MAHQREALNDVVTGFQDSDRGKLIMACGTGKTFAALRIAEKMAGIGGRVLYLVPSIGLFSQAMREWAEQQGVTHRYIGICSDESTGKEHGGCADSGAGDTGDDRPFKDFGGAAGNRRRGDDSGILHVSFVYRWSNWHRLKGHRRSTSFCATRRTERPGLMRPATIRRHLC